MHNIKVYYFQIRSLPTNLPDPSHHIAFGKIDKHMDGTWRKSDLHNIHEICARRRKEFLELKQ